MKKFILSVLFISTFGALSAQCTGCGTMLTDSVATPAKQFYFLWRMGFGYQTLPANKGSLSVQFPFQAYNTVSGANLACNFTSSKDNPFSKNSWTYEMIDMEFGMQRIFFPVKLGFNMTYRGNVYFQGGAGVNLFIRGPETKYNLPDYNYPNLLQLSAQIGMTWYDTHLGGIDNNNNQIYVLGYNAKTYFITSGKYSHKVYAKHLDAFLSSASLILIQPLVTATILL